MRKKEKVRGDSEEGEGGGRKGESRSRAIAQSRTSVCVRGGGEELRGEGMPQRGKGRGEEEKRGSSFSYIFLNFFFRLTNSEGSVGGRVFEEKSSEPRGEERKGRMGERAALFDISP